MRVTRRRRWRRATGYRTKNKNSTQRCGEKRKLMDIGTKVLPCLPLCGFIQTQGWQQEHQTSTTYPMWLWRHAGIFARDSEKRARARSPKWCGAKTCNQAEPEPKDLASKQHVSKQQTTRGHPRTVPHLPCERAVAPQRPSAPPEPALCHKCHLPRMPRKSSVDVSKCQGCHAKAAGMSPSAACHIKETWTSPSPAPATQRAAAPWATNADQARHQSQPRALVPWLPPQTKGTHATQSANLDQVRRQSQPSAVRAMPAMQKHLGCYRVPRLPRKKNVDVAKSHACHAKSHGAPDDHRGASPDPAYSAYKCHAWHARATSMSPSALLATHISHACHTKETSMCVKAVCDKDVCVWQGCMSERCVWKMVCDKGVCVRELCVKDGVKEVCACERERCVWKMCVCVTSCV